jgi:hypothetical protein
MSSPVPAVGAFDLPIHCSSVIIRADGAGTVTHFIFSPEADSGITGATWLAIN